MKVFKSLGGLKDGYDVLTHKDPVGLVINFVVLMVSWFISRGLLSLILMAVEKLFDITVSDPMAEWWGFFPVLFGTVIITALILSSLDLVEDPTVNNSRIPNIQASDTITYSSEMPDTLGIPTKLGKVELICSKHGPYLVDNKDDSECPSCRINDSEA